VKLKLKESQGIRGGERMKKNNEYEGKGCCKVPVDIYTKPDFNMPEMSKNILAVWNKNKYVTRHQLRETQVLKQIMRDLDLIFKGKFFCISDKYNRHYKELKLTPEQIIKAIEDFFCTSIRFQIKVKGKKISFNEFLISNHHRLDDDGYLVEWNGVVYSNLISNLDIIGRGQKVYRLIEIEG